MLHFQPPRKLSGAIWACVIATSFLVGGGITAINLVGDGAAIPWAGSNQTAEGGAKATAATYLGYLSAGDAKAATQMSDPEVGVECNGFLSEEVFSNAKSHISEVEITGAERDGESDRYEVSFEYVLDGADYEASISTSYSSYDRRWSIEPATHELEVDAVAFEGSHGTINVSGVDIDRVPEASCDWKAYPALYELRAPDHGFVVAKPHKLLVPFASENDEDLKVGIDDSYTLADDVLPVIEEKLPAIVDKCMTAEALFTDLARGKECSLFQLVAAKSNVSNLLVEVVEYPNITIGDVYSNGVLVSIVGGRMNLSYSALDKLAKEDGIQDFSDMGVEILWFPSTYVARFIDGEIVLERFS